MAVRLRVLVRLVRAAVVTAAAAIAVSVLAFGAGPGRAAASARLIGGGVTSISCPSAGECSAVGFLDFRDQTRPLVVSEKNGAWGSARTVAGLSALPLGDHGAALGVLSCSSVGNCAAGGDYAPDGPGRASEGLIVTERNGVWGNAEAVAGLARLNAGQSASVEFMSCRSAGNCAAAGPYQTRDMNDHVFVVSEKNGAWGTAEPIRGLTAPGVFESFVSALSCGSAGNCTVTGSHDGTTGSGAFWATQKNGVWGAAQTFPTLAKGAGIDTLACWPAGTCTATGNYRGEQFFSITRTRGAWGAPVPIPGFAALPGGRPDPIGFILSCPSPGNCTLGGEYVSARDGFQVFVAGQKDGTWGQARVLPRLARLNTGQMAFLDGLECFSAGTCTAAGDYAIRHPTYTAAAVFVTAEKNGTWGRPERVPGSLANLGTSVQLAALSCGAPGNCSIGGSYQTKIDNEPFLDTQQDGTWAQARPVRIQP